MSIILTIIVLACIFIYEQEEKEKKSKPRIIGYRPVTGEPIFNKKYDEQPIGFDIHTGQPIYKSDQGKKVIEPKPKIKTPEEKTRITNSVLMITGAILIVFASIIFLATSWDVLHGMIKTLILIALQGIFFLFSYICLNTFHIEKTSKLFKYLAFIFLPIILISLSCFELVGEYFSIDGEGYKLFFGLSFLISNLIFFLIGKQTKDPILSRMGYILGLIGIFFISNNFMIDNTLPITIVAICNIILYVIIEKNILNKHVYIEINNITNYFIIALLIILLSFDGTSLSTNLGIFLYSIYYFLKHYFETDEIKQRRYTIFYLGLYGLSLTILKNISIPPYFLYILALIPLLLLTKLVKKDTIRNLIIYGILIISSIVSIQAALNLVTASNNEIYYVLTYVVAFILDTITYLMSKKGIAKILSYLSFTAIFLSIFYVVELREYMKYIPLVTIVLVYFLEILFDKLKDKSSDIFFQVMIMAESVLLIETYAVLIPLIFMIFYIKTEHKDEALLILPMLMSLSLFMMEKTILSQVLCCILIIIYSLLSLNKKGTNVYTIVSFISIFIGDASFKFHPIVFSLLLLLWSASHLYLSKDNKFFKFATFSSALILYINIINLLELDYSALYLPGFYLYLIYLTQYLFQGDIKDIKFIGCFGIVAITYIGLRLMGGVTDAIIILFSLLIVTIVSFIKKWNHLLYTSLVCMIVNVIFLTWEFWTQVPWYIYILIIGFALIGFAMFDEKRKQDKKKIATEELLKQEKHEDMK